MTAPAVLAPRRSILSRKLLEVLPFALASAPLFAQEQPAPAAPPMAVVEVSHSVAGNRRDASAAKLVVTRDELTRFGDNNLTDALQRVPGVSIDRAAGKDAAVRMRGLGSGYTQVLVNGEPVPQGFSIDSISPGQIDRIEVLRTATADMSNQSIAGTINIVLKAANSKLQREFKIGAGAYDGRYSPMIFGDFSDRAATLSYGAGLSASVDRDHWPTTSVIETTSVNGAPLAAYRTDAHEIQRDAKLSVTPRATWKPNERHSLALTGLVQLRDLDYRAPDQRAALYGAPPVFASDLLVTDERSTQARGSANWKGRIGADGKIDAKLTVMQFSRTAESYFDAADALGQPVLHRAIDSELEDRSLALSGKYSVGMWNGHALDIGWDGARGRRNEFRNQVETSPVGFPTLDLAEDYAATVSRLAWFIQDDWTISSQLSGYLGVRHEVLTTRTDGNVLAPIRSRSSVVSPTAQVLWKIPGTKSDQLRVSLGRTFKAPTGRDLIPRRWVVNLNSASTPNFQGNPDLRPELAWGLDLAYERYMAGDTFVGLNAYGRKISGVVLPSIYQSGGTWIESPMNSGDADVYGLEFEAKGKLKKLIADAPDVDLRLGLSRNWSRLDSVPRPDNRLNRQPTVTASLGADWRRADRSLTLGGSFVFEKGGYTRVTTMRSADKSDKELLDIYALKPINKWASIRMTATNLLARDDVLQTYYFGQDINESMSSHSETFRKIKLVLELKL